MQRQELQRGFRLVAGLVGLILASVALLLGVSWWQTQHLELVPVTPELDDVATSKFGRIELDLELTQLVIEPIPPGQPPRLEARFDPARFHLEQHLESEPPPTGDAGIWRIRLAPTGSSTMALIRAKVGAPLAHLRLGLPTDLAITLTGSATRSILAAELGTTSLRGLDLRNRDGAVKISFSGPTSVPVEDIRIHGRRGLVELTGVGNANPRSVELEQSLGVLEADLRGSWTRDAEIRLGGRLTGGTVWLPSNVEVLGADSPPLFADPALDPEGGPRPITLKVEATTSMGRLVMLR